MRAIGVLVGALAGAAPSLGEEVAAIIRIPLVNHDQLQFFGTVLVGSPPVPFRVIFDTGSSDVWLPSAHCRACSGSQRYNGSVSTTYLDEPENFQAYYGSGAVAGRLFYDDVALPALAPRTLRMGSVERQDERIQQFESEGIVGLGFPALASFTAPSFLQAFNVSLFSLYISPLPSDPTPSQLILHGIDPDLEGPATTWHYVSLAEEPSTAGFWAVPLRGLAIGSASVQHKASIAVLDSGTSLLLLPLAEYAAVVTQLCTAMGGCEDGAARSSLSCSDCRHGDFPPLTFTLGTTAFTLQGSDYVRCEFNTCMPQIDKSTSSFIVLGDIFMRAYYTAFDVTHRRIGLACLNDGRCAGGLKPPLNLSPVLSWLLYAAALYTHAFFITASGLGLKWIVNRYQARPKSTICTPRLV
ncbi:aspartyl protease family A01A [Achlya hypogyna]|uniref:Aspartyl protease family A01A n=1 Tax=Achlya hypogyna TaxID=1202772 RepID=A0A1V9YXC7_ACHHY|nr:aspartyl protease family A01A [Achlya hypogyna]